jgi:hypothetical protein
VTGVLFDYTVATPLHNGAAASPTVPVNLKSQNTSVSITTLSLEAYFLHLLALKAKNKSKINGFNNSTSIACFS